MLVREGEAGPDWSAGKGGQVSVRLLAQVTGNELLPHILPFIQVQAGSSLLSLDLNCCLSIFACFYNFLLRDIIRGPGRGVGQTIYVFYLFS